MNCDFGDVSESWRKRWEDKPTIRPSCYNRKAWARIVDVPEFNMQYEFRMSIDCPHWSNKGGNAYVRKWCDSAGGLRTPWSSCNGCEWKKGA